MELTENGIDTRDARAADERIDFLCEAGGAMARYGERTGRIENRLSACAETLGVDAQFYMLPTALFASFGRGARASTVVINTERTTVDLRRLMAVGEVVESVARGERTVEYGLAMTRLIEASPPRRRWYWRALAAGAAGSSIAVVFGGGLPALFATVLVGTAVGVLLAAGTRVKRLVLLLELLSGLIATLLTVGLWHLWPSFSVGIVVLASLTVLTPGLAITRGVSELAAGHLVSGTSRLAGGAITAANLAVGVAMGTYFLDELRWMPPTFQLAPLPTELVVAVSVVVGGFAYGALMNARLRDLPGICLSWGTAVYGLRLGEWLAGPTLSVVIAALLVGIVCNLWSRFTGTPAVVPRVPGLIVLVPGAIGFRWAEAVVDASLTSGSLIILLAMVAVGLVVGLLIADTTVPEPTAGHVPQGTRETVA